MRGRGNLTREGVQGSDLEIRITKELNIPSLSTYRIPDTVLGSVNIVMNKTAKIPAVTEFTSYWEETDNKHNK